MVERYPSGLYASEYARGEDVPWVRLPSLPRLSQAKDVGSRFAHRDWITRPRALMALVLVRPAGVFRRVCRRRPRGGVVPKDDPRLIPRAIT